MELIFRRNPNTGSWVAEFEATADVALHIEGVDEGTVKIYQRGTASGQYALTKDGTPAVPYGKVYDYEIPILIAPKFIKVVCRTEPTYAEVVSNGEITELKYQEKSVEVTANGNTEVIPDAGFAGLTKVNVSVNVPQSGGGNSGGGNGSNMEYIDVRGVSNAVQKTQLLAYSSNAKFGAGGDFMINSFFALYGNFGDQVKDMAVAVAIDLSTKVMASGETSTFGEVLTSSGINLASLPRLTEEEFYNLNA